ncbi:transposase, partial [Amphritea sp. RP18W]|nr:transposase [Amphritea pacifica]
NSFLFEFFRVLLITTFLSHFYTSMFDVYSLLLKCPVSLDHYRHNKQVVFAEDRDYQYYLNTLAEFKDEFQVVVHAYCLMTNHVHLLLEPETAELLSNLVYGIRRHSYLIDPLPVLHP